MYLEFCTDDQLRDIYAEFEATPEIIEKNVQYLINWLEQQPHLPKISDRKWLENILLRCKNQLKKAETFLDQYYSCRAECPYLFTHRDPCADELQRCLKIIISIPMPKLTPDGYRVMCYRIFKHTSDDIPDCEVLLRSYQIQMDIILKEDRHKGLIVVVNMENMSYKLFTMFLSSLRQSLVMATRVNKVRLHKVYIVNMMSVFGALVTMTKCILKKELADRFEVWNKSSTDVVEIVPKDCLPKEYGGDGESLEEYRDRWREYLKTFKEWLIAEENIKADLSKKPKKSFFKSMIGSAEEVV